MLNIHPNLASLTRFAQADEHADQVELYLVHGSSRLSHLVQNTGSPHIQLLSSPYAQHF